VIDTKPRPEGLTTAQADGLQALARQVMAQLELRRVVLERAGTAPRRSERRLRNALAIRTVGVIFWDAAFRLTEANDAFLQMSGFSQEDVLGRTWQELTPEEFHPVSHRAVQEIMTHGEATPYEKEYLRKDGSRWWGMFAPRKVGEEVVEFVLDITDRRQMEAALRASKAKLAAIFDNASVGLSEIDPDSGRFLRANDELCRILGRTREQVLAVSIADVTHPDDVPPSVTLVSRALEGRASATLDKRYVRPDGTLVWANSTATALPGGQSGSRSLLVVTVDLTARRQAEEAVRASEERLRGLMEGIPQLVWRAVGDGRWTWSSPQWSAYTGLPCAESLGLGWLRPVHPDDRNAMLAAWQLAEEAGSLSVEHRVHNAAEGRYRWFTTRAVPLRDEHGRILEWLGTSTDIDDLRQLQEQQHVMVAELQHRTRNLLGVVTSLFRQTQRRNTSLEAVSEQFRERLDALARVNGLLSRSEQSRITIGELVRTELDALGACTMGQRVRIDGPSVPLRSSTVQTLALALHELATNARKYGALATEHGSLAVTWSVREAGNEGPRLMLDWIEEVGAPARLAAAPEKRGYGRELIEEALPYALKARTSYELGNDGVRCYIDLPLTGAQRGGRSTA
jgi:PAS domain S-box-containing protein